MNILSSIKRGEDLGKTARKYIQMLMVCIIILSPFLSHQVQAAEISIEVNGKNFQMEGTFLIEARTYLPIRQFSELLGATVDWNEKQREVLIEKDNII